MVYDAYMRILLFYFSDRVLREWIACMIDMHKWMKMRLCELW